MEFIFEPSLNFLAVKEPSLYELFQSSKPAVPADVQIAESAAEAYICTEKENSALKVYLAFWEISRKTTRIYTPKSQPCGTNEYQDCLDAARKYLADLGFTMEQVNLNYSTAMRQVIWGAIKIFKAPKANPHAEAKKKGHESPLPVRQAIKPEPIAVPPVAVVQAVAGSETDQTVTQLSEELQQVRSLLSAKELEAAISAEQVIQANNSLIAAELCYADRIQGLEKERDILSGELGALKTQVPELEARVVDARAKDEEARQEFERLLAIERGLKTDAENELQLLSQEKEQIERVATAALNSARGERKELLDKVDSLELENRRLKEELERQLAELRLSEEKAQAELLALKKELVVRKRVHTRELAGLRGELRRLVEEQAALETGCLMIEAFTAENEALISAETSNIAAVESVVVDGMVPEQCEGEVDDLVAPLELEPLVSDTMEFSLFQAPVDAGDAVTEFMPNCQLEIVPCTAPEDLVALYESSNKVQTALDGFKTQKSGGYICAVKRNGNPEIFLLWEMLESNQAVLYTPRSQPKDEQSFQQILQDALFYFDSVGFMMSPVDLSVPVNRSNAISKIQLPLH